MRNGVKFNIGGGSTFSKAIYFRSPVVFYLKSPQLTYLHRSENKHDTINKYSFRNIFEV